MSAKWWDNRHISHWRMQIYLCYEMNYFLSRMFTCWAWGGGPDRRLHFQKTYPLCRGGRNCQTQKIFLLSSSAADDYPSVKQTSDQSENRKLNQVSWKSGKYSFSLFLPIHSISYLYWFLIFNFDVSDLVFHSAPFSLKSQFLFPLNVAVSVLQRFISIGDVLKIAS